MTEESARRRRIGILVCGEIPADLRDAHGTYAQMMTGLLGPGFDAPVFKAFEGALPADVSACDGYVLTGSAAGVYDDLPWIAPLLRFLRAARGRARLVGICFGHQAMAEAFGGRVEKAAIGWGIGMHDYAVVGRAPWMDAVESIRVPASHQDQVVLRPPEARVVLASDFTPLAGLDYGDAISFQGHLEFTPEFGRALVETRRDRFGALADQAIASYGTAGDGARVAGWIRRFLAAG